MKAVVQFRGREIAHTDLGRKLLMRLAEDLTAYGVPDGSARMEGRNAHILISPVKTQIPAKPAAPARTAPPAEPPAAHPQN